MLISGSIFALLLLYLTSAIYGYQQVVNEGIALADERCMSIDPVINKKRDLSFRYTEILTDPSPTLDTAREFNTIIEQLPKAFSDTVSISEPWLKRQRAYLDSWRFKLFTLKKAKENLNAQYDKYSADLESNKLMLKIFQDPNNTKLEQPLRSAIERQKQVGILWDAKFDALQKSFDFRSPFIHSPKTKCIDSGMYDSPSVDPEKAPITG